METLKAKLIQELDAINDEDLLLQVFTVVHNFINKDQVIILNEEQIAIIKQAQEDYRNGNYHDSEEVFDELLKD